MEFKDYYKTLGIKRDATKEEIKRAYRKMARKYHPDVSNDPEAEARFKEVNEANEVLGDPEKRAAYDQFGANRSTDQNFTPPPGWDQGFEFHGGGFTDANAEDFSDFFESLFGRAGRRSNGRQSHREFHTQSQDTHAKISINLEDAYLGSQQRITLRHAEYGPDGRPQLKERTLKVKIPKGIRSGQNIRLRGQGEPGLGAGRAGDLYLEVTINPHSLYHVEGSDVYLDLPVAPWEAALSARVKVPMPGGNNVELTIPANSTSGTKLRLRGKGLPAKTPGDFYVVLTIVLPKVESDAQRKAFENLKDEFDFNPRSGMEGNDEQ